MARHVADRPSWQCRVDWVPWPCEAARRELRLIWASDPIGLAVFMGDQLHLAAKELHDPAPQELYDRFLAWTRYTGPPAEGAQ